jgi:hypothetical protein
VMITNSVEEAVLLSDRIVPMTRGPRASLGASIVVEMARPRSLAQLLHDPEAVRVRAHVVEWLTDAVRRARSEVTPARDGTVDAAATVESVDRQRIESVGVSPSGGEASC